MRGRSLFALIDALVIDVPAMAEDAPVETTAAESAYVWKATCEAGFTLTEGNSSSRAASGSCGLAHSSGKLTVGLSAAANYGKARYGGLGTYPDVRRGVDNRIPRGDFIESVRNFLVSLREDYALTDDGLLDVYAIEAWESDIFKGYDARWMLEAGLGYAYVKTESQMHRVGVGLQYENEQFIVADADGASPSIASAASSRRSARSPSGRRLPSNTRQATCPTCCTRKPTGASSLTPRSLLRSTAGWPSRSAARSSTTTIPAWSHRAIRSESRWPGRQQCRRARPTAPCTRRWS